MIALVVTSIVITVHIADLTAVESWVAFLVDGLLDNEVMSRFEVLVFA